MKILGIFLGLFCAMAAQAGTFYSERPLAAAVSKESIDSASLQQAKQQLGEKLLGSLVNFVAELRILYGDARRFYLGRDGELLYDLDQMIWEGESEKGIEPRLINVSRNSSKSAHLYEYLEDHDLTHADAAVLADTGYEGSVVDEINRVLADHGKSSIPAHLMSSVHPKSPSSRVSTQPYYTQKKIAKKLTFENKEEFLDRVDEQVTGIEELAHYTKTAGEFRRHPKTNLWEAYSKEDPDASEQQVSLGLQWIVRKKLLREAGALARVVSLESTLAPFIARLKQGHVDAAEVERVYRFTVDARFDLFWPDLREAIAKQTVKVPAGAAAALWKALPNGLPELFDLEEGQERLILALEASLDGPPLESSEENRLPIEDILDFHVREQLDDTPSTRAREIAAFRNSISNKQFRFRGKKQAVGAFLGEGVRAEVFALGADWILKVPFSADDMRYISVETQVSDYLQEHFNEYPVRVLPPLDRGKHGEYIVRARIPAENLGENILKNGKGLAADQMQALEQLFLHTKRFAAATGIGLDIKPDNLAWVDGEWVLFDTGPRTSYGPYAFSLDIHDFKEFFQLWQDDSPRKNGISIKDVIHSHKNGECAELILKNRRP